MQPVHPGASFSNYRTQICESNRTRRRQKNGPKGKKTHGEAGGAEEGVFVLEFGLEAVEPDGVGVCEEEGQDAEEDTARHAPVLARLEQLNHLGVGLERNGNPRTNEKGVIQNRK